MKVPSNRVVFRGGRPEAMPGGAKTPYYVTSRAARGGIVPQDVWCEDQCHRIYTFGTLQHRECLNHCRASD